PYALGVTLLHEVAHLVTHLKHQSRRRLQPHGPEWQRHYTAILQPVLAASFLPEDLAEALMAAGERPRAATCSDRRLLLALARYDATADDRCRIEELSPGTIFETETGRRFILGTRLRSRYRCLGPLFDRRVLESGPFVTPGDHAGVSEGGRSHGRSREQGEAKKCAHGFNRGARKAGTPQLLTMIAAGQVLALPEARRAGITGSKERD
ncbi:MAG: hypothetical protein EBZ13_08210, partial [Planctomycetia bacterium]|nr:hypothetical protein [Planctomycetia bacterium]